MLGGNANRYETVPTLSSICKGPMNLDDSFLRLPNLTTPLLGIFGTIFKQSQTMLRFGFAPGTDVFGFCGVFWYHNIR